MCTVTTCQTLTDGDADGLWLSGSYLDQTCIYIIRRHGLRGALGGSSQGHSVNHARSITAMARHATRLVLRCGRYLESVPLTNQSQCIPALACELRAAMHGTSLQSSWHQQYSFFSSSSAAGKRQCLPTNSICTYYVYRLHHVDVLQAAQAVVTLVAATAAAPAVVLSAQVVTPWQSTSIA